MVHDIDAYKTIMCIAILSVVFQSITSIVAILAVVYAHRNK